MPRNTSVTLGDHFNDFIERQLDAGRYGTASEVVRAGLRLLENDDARMEALRRALREGIDSGVARDFDFDAWLGARYRDASRDEAA